MCIMAHCNSVRFIYNTNELLFKIEMSAMLSVFIQPYRVHNDLTDSMFTGARIQNVRRLKVCLKKCLARHKRISCTLILLVRMIFCQTKEGKQLLSLDSIGSDFMHHGKMPVHKVLVYIGKTINCCCLLQTPIQVMGTWDDSLWINISLGCLIDNTFQLSAKIHCDCTPMTDDWNLNGMSIVLYIMYLH